MNKQLRIYMYIYIYMLLVLIGVIVAEFAASVFLHPKNKKRADVFFSTYFL